MGWDNGRVCLNSPYSAYRLSIIKASSASSSIRTDCLCQMEYAQQDTPLIRRSIRRSHTPQDNAARQQRHGQKPASRLLIYLARLPFSDGRLKNAPSLLAYGEPDDRPSATCAPPEVHALRSTTLEVTWHFVRLNVAAHSVRLRSSATQRLDCLVPRYEPLRFYRKSPETSSKRSPDRCSSAKSSPGLSISALFHCDFTNPSGPAATNML